MKHLKIEQSTSSIEVVDPKVIDKLYNLVLFHPVGESLDSTSNLKGNLLCSHAYGDVVDYLTTNYKDLSISVTGGIYIRFEDKNVETICATNFGDGTGITTVQASVVTDMSEKFANNTSITTFNELKLFTNLKMNNNGTNFNNCTALTSIDLSNITKVGTVGNYFPYVFLGCTNLNNVVFNTNTESIGTFAFLNCTKFNTVIPTSIKYLGASALRDSGYAQDVNLPNLIDVTTSVTNLNLNDIDSLLLKEWFAGTKITKVTDLGSITKLGDVSNLTGGGGGPFSSCHLLQSVVLPTTLLKLGATTFDECDSLLSVTGMQNVTTLYNAVFHDCKLLLTIDDVSNVVYIGSSTFGSCTSLTSLNLTTACNTINGSFTFYNCSNLTTIGDTSNAVITDGNQTFNGCSNLTSIAFKSTTITDRTDYMFSYCSKVTSITGDLSGITKFGDCMFSNCLKLSSITLPSSLVRINNSVFDTCLSLISVTIPKSVNYMGIGVFGECNSLTSINFEIGGTTSLYLGARLIKNCTSLNKLVLPANLSNIEALFLMYHDNASTIVINATTVPTLNGAIGGSPDTLFYVPDSSLNAYKAATNWSDLASRIYGMSTYPIGTEIPSKAFLNWTGLANMDLTNVTLINDHAFAGSGLANNYTVGPMLICSSTVESTIEEWAFWGAKLIESITLPYVSNIGTGAFSDCTALLRVILGSHIVGIGNLCFLNCTALDFIHIDSTACPVLSSYAFDGAKSTFKIYVPDAQVSAYKAASVWSTFADKIYSFTQLDTDFPGTR